MNPATEANYLWYKEVILPKINQIREWSVSVLPLASLQISSFFKDLLIDLEVISLDNFTVELYISEILDGIRTYENSELARNKEQLKPLAMMALLSSRIDRALFMDYWMYYRPFKKRHPDLKDESLIRALKLQINLKKLADYIEQNTKPSISP